MLKFLKALPALLVFGGGFALLGSMATRNPANWWWGALVLGAFGLLMGAGFGGLLDGEEKR